MLGVSNIQLELLEETTKRVQHNLNARKYSLKYDRIEFCYTEDTSSIKNLFTPTTIQVNSGLYSSYRTL